MRAAPNFLSLFERVRYYFALIPPFYLPPPPLMPVVSAQPGSWSVELACIQGDLLNGKKNGKMASSS
jgi:hypothetical protein